MSGDSTFMNEKAQNRKYVDSLQVTKSVRNRVRIKIW